MRHRVTHISGELLHNWCKWKFKCLSLSCKLPSQQLVRITLGSLPPCLTSASCVVKLESLLWVWVRKGWTQESWARIQVTVGIRFYLLIARNTHLLQSWEHKTSDRVYGFWMFIMLSLSLAHCQGLLKLLSFVHLCSGFYSILLHLKGVNCSSSEPEWKVILTLALDYNCRYVSKLDRPHILFFYLSDPL